MENCSYGAPFLLIPQGDKAQVYQACCNHWDCPKCGPERARHEYGRIVSGAREIAQNRPNLWFLTITCRGAELSIADAEKGYLEWTNRFLDAARAKCKRDKQDWFYVQVTERQKRKHPHSHILTSFDVGDTRLDWLADWKMRKCGLVNEWKAGLRSDWLARAVVNAGLGQQYDISIVHSVEAASRYIAKYLFKDSLLTVWPKGWKRVRYSQNWPKLEKTTDVKAIPLVNDGDVIRTLGSYSALYTKEAAVASRLRSVARYWYDNQDCADVVLVGD